MLPKPPARDVSLGFLLLDQFRIQGTSTAGEATCIQAPELDVCFDMGACPRAMLSSKYVALSHGHMDHVGGLAYWCSQRNFQGMGVGNIICDERIADDVRAMMNGYVKIERQETPYNLITLQPDQEMEVKNNIFLKGFPVEHTVPAFGYSIIEKRTKLKDEYVGMPQDKLMELKSRGIEIVRPLQIPLVAYTGDLAPGPALLREDVRKAQIVVIECTFFEPQDVDRAKTGLHLHAETLAEWLRVSECKHVVITHVSRRTNLGFARKRLTDLVGNKTMEKVHFLMDYKINKERYERQMIAAGMPIDVKAGRGGGGGGGRPRFGGGGGGGGGGGFSGGSGRRPFRPHSGSGGGGGGAPRTGPGGPAGGAGGGPGASGGGGGERPRPVRPRPAGE